MDEEMNLDTLDYHKKIIRALQNNIDAAKAELDEHAESICEL